MKHRYRFWGQSIADEWFISDDEAHHLLKVLRLTEDDEIEVFDGAGRWVLGYPEKLSKSKVKVQVKQEFQEGPSRHLLNIVIGSLKPKTFEQILPSLVELGCQNVHVFLQKHSPKSNVSDKHRRKWDTLIKESCKQSKRAWLPCVKTWNCLNQFLDAIKDQNCTKIVLSEKAEKSLLHIKSFESDIYLLVGSEGGLSKEEEEAADAAEFRACHMSSHILRAKTAAIAAAAVIQMLQS